jgi:hypothetical protein
MTHLKRIPLAVALLAALTLAALALSACSSAASTASGTNSTSSTSGASQAVSAACEQVGAVLSDGPDPGADPVGYAEAQVSPLRQISTQDTKLRAAIGKLADAYQVFYTSNGNKSAGEAVTVASNAINKICPGAAS